MATIEDRIEKLESEMQELKESVQKLTTESQFLGSSMCEIKEMLSKSEDKLDSLSISKSDQSIRFKTTTHDQPQPTTLDFPKYSGDDPMVWLDRVSQYFDYQGTPEDRKVTLAAFHLEGEANRWWHWMKKVFQEEKTKITWKKFKKELLVRFGPMEDEDFDEALSKICQRGTLREYQRQFERLANQVDGWPQKALVGAFMGGLKEEIASEIRMFKPKILSEAIELARIKDESLNRRRQGKKGFQQSNSMTKSLPKLSPPSTLGTTNQAMDIGSTRRISWEEMQRGGEKGLYFSCNEKFTPTHRCATPQAFLVEGYSQQDLLEVTDCKWEEDNL